MGTYCVIVVIEQDHDTENNITLLNPICAIVRSMNGQQAFDLALELADESTIINGAYDGQTDTEFNGAGAFALRMIDRIRRNWEDHTTLVPPSEFIAEGGLDAGDFDLALAVYAPRIEGAVTHNLHDWSK